MSLKLFGCSEVLKGLFTIPLSLAPAWTVSSICQLPRRRYKPPATAAPVAASPSMNCRRLRNEDFGVISEEEISFGFLISKWPSQRLSMSVQIQYVLVPYFRFILKQKVTDKPRRCNM